MSVDKIVARIVDLSSPNLEHRFSIWCTNKDFLRLTVVAMVTKIWEFCVEQAVFKVAQFIGITESYQRITLVAMVTKIWNFNTKLAISVKFVTTVTCLRAVTESS